MAVLTSERLTLRPFTQRDVPAILALLSDPVVNTFLPWYPLKTEAEAQTFYQERLRGPYCWACVFMERMCRWATLKSVPKRLTTWAMP